MATAKQIRQRELENPDDPNVRDPEHAHELGGTLGMTAGGVVGGAAVGAAAVSAVASPLAAPIGAVAGAAIGGALGGKAGEAIAREVNPTAEEKYWEENYADRPYIVESRDFETYRPAYRYGIDAYQRYPDREFDQIESDLGRDWSSARGTSSLEWQEAREASRDAYDRLSTRSPRQVK